jgi:hypothetical protein
MKFTRHVLIAAVMSMGISGVAAAQDQNRPAASDHAPHNPAMKSPDAYSWGTLSKGHNSFTASEAIRRFKKAGYTNVTNVTLDHDGLWQAHAMNHDRMVDVALDYKGTLAEQ